MNNTPTSRTDATTHADVSLSWINTGGAVMRMVPIDFARQLERELAEAKASKDAIANRAEAIRCELVESLAREARLRKALEQVPCRCASLNDTIKSPRSDGRPWQCPRCEALSQTQQTPT